MNEPTVVLKLTLGQLEWIKVGLDEITLAGEDPGDALLEMVYEALETLGKNDQYEGMGHDAGDF